MDVAVKNFTETLQNVDKRVHIMRQFQQLSRGLESRDYNLLVENLSYVSTWSMVQCSVVVFSGVMQVYFVRHLFSDNRKTGTKTSARA
jgi:hypothetical protein